MTTNTVRIVLDTNMILSASVFGGMVEIIIDLILADKLSLYISAALIDEVAKKLKEFKADEEVIAKVAATLEKGITVIPSIRITASRDPKDNFLLELSESAQADYLITRDKDLLDLPNQEWKSTKIMKPEDFLPFLRKKGILLRSTN